MREPGSATRLTVEEHCREKGLVLPHPVQLGSVEAIKQEVQDRVRLLGEGGGYVFATIHNIQPDIPPEKVVAIYEAVAECAADRTGQTVRNPAAFSCPMTGPSLGATPIQ